MATKADNFAFPLEPSMPKLDHVADNKIIELVQWL
jgi:hypothetical protein